MTGAFAGDHAVKAALLDRLHAHAADGTLRFGATAWDGRGGSPLGVSTQGGDCVDYAAQFGYPLALAGLLDPMTAQASPDRAVDTALSWVSCVEVGADLSLVPERIVGHLLAAMGVDRLAAPYHVELFALYRAEALGAAPQRRAWAELRERIALAVEAETPRSDAHAALTACATACWPLTTSSSVLPTLIAVWLQDVNRGAGAELDRAGRSRAQAMLDEIYQESQPQRDAGQPVDIPALFRTRAPLLAAAFEAQLAGDNARYLDRVRTVPAMVLGHLAAAGS
jgi:hypothetical protein